jgi:hypothetical protein
MSPEEKEHLSMGNLRRSACLVLVCFEGIYFLRNLCSRYIKCGITFWGFIFKKC